MGVAQIGVKIPGTSQGAGVPKPHRLDFRAGVEARACRSEFLVARTHRRMGKFVAQLNACGQRPSRQVAASFQVGVLGTGSDNQAQPAGDGMAPAQIDDVVINLPAGILRKLKQLKTVDYPELIVTGKQMAVSALNCDLVAVDQSIGGVEKMSVAESASHGDRGARIETLHRIENHGVRKPGNVPNGTELTVAEVMATRQTPPLASVAQAAGGQT